MVSYAQVPEHVSEYVLEQVEFDPVAVTMNGNAPFAFGVPDSTPEEDSDRPGGSDPPVTVQTGEVIPDCVNDWEYATPSEHAANEDVVIPTT